MFCTEVTTALANFYQGLGDHIAFCSSRLSDHGVSLNQQISRTHSFIKALSRLDFVENPNLGFLLSALQPKANAVQVFTFALCTVFHY